MAPTLSAESFPDSMTPSPSSEPIDGQGSDDWPRENRLGAVGLIFGALGLAVVGGAGYASVIRQEIPEDLRIRYILLPIIGGLLGYNYLALDLPGATNIFELMGPFAGFIVATISGAFVMFATQIWCQNRINKKK